MHRLQVHKVSARAAWVRGARQILCGSRVTWAACLCVDANTERAGCAELCTLCVTAHTTLPNRQNPFGLTFSSVEKLHFLATGLEGVTTPKIKNKKNEFSKLRYQSHQHNRPNAQSKRASATLQISWRANTQSCHIALIKSPRNFKGPH